MCYEYCFLQAEDLVELLTDANDTILERINMNLGKKPVMAIRTDYIWYMIRIHFLQIRQNRIRILKILRNLNFFTQYLPSIPLISPKI